VKTAMNTTLFKADTRGHANYGWLDTHHVFSFGSYMHPERMNFGMLRVFNDDVVEGGSGFGEHPHRNMEIISIPLKGVLMHRDSMGHAEALHPGDVQVMSAGSGITHSEFNGSTPNLWSSCRSGSFLTHPTFSRGTTSVESSFHKTA
jgi:redox-sensitive bicupin YhaK (pirin superfamily)